ncbi:MAG: DUF2156 domain-containing protein [Synergistaceae bacterium]|nr:DUF2156 domain-containing protein [Synergistaceae bacterium]
MLDFHPISLDVKELVESYTFKYGEGSCQHSFVSSWTLRHKYGDEFCEHEGFLYTLRSKLCTEGERIYLFPHGERSDSAALTRAVQNVIDDAHEHNCRVKFQTLTQSAKDIITSLFPGRFTAEYSRDWSEYIYRTENMYIPENMISPSAHHLMRKRRSIRTFRKDYDGRFTVTRISPEHIGMIKEFQEEWLDEKLMNDDNPILERQLEEENFSVQRALDDFFALGLSGIVVFIDGELKGYAYGSKLSGECYDGAVGKGARFIPNISPFLKHELVRLCCEEFRYINLEEDLGVKGLREMKTEYMPEYMIEKYTVTEI